MKGVGKRKGKKMRDKAISSPSSTRTSALLPPSRHAHLIPPTLTSQEPHPFLLPHQTRADHHTLTHPYVPPQPRHTLLHFPRPQHTFTHLLLLPPQYLLFQTRPFLFFFSTILLPTLHILITLSHPSSKTSHVHNITT